MIDLEFNVPGLEMIKFDSNSKLVKELNKCWERCFEIRDSVDRKDVFDSVKTMVDEVLPDVRKTIEKYTNIDLNITANEGNFYVSFTGKDQKEFRNLTDAISGETKLKARGKSILDKFENIVDIEKGKINMEYMPVDIKLGLNIDLLHTILAPIISTHIFSRKDNVNMEFKPEEITAIVLHEIGHVFTMFHFARFGMAMNDYNSASREELYNNVKKRDGKALKKSANETYKAISKLSNDKKLKDDIKKRFTSLDNDGIGIVGIIMLAMLNFYLQAIYIYMWSLFVFISYMKHDIADVSRFFMNGESLYTQTYSDMATPERLADEFVASFNYSEHVNTGLDKYLKILKTSHSKATLEQLKSTSGFKGFIYSSFLSIASVINNMSVGLLMDAVDINNPLYEDSDQRRKRNLENMYAMINGSKTLTQKEKDDITVSISNLRDYDSKQDRNVGKLIHKFLKLMVKFNYNLSTGIAANLINNQGSAREFDDLFNDFDKLLGNSAKYHSNRLDMFIDRR